MTSIGLVSDMLKDSKLNQLFGDSTIRHVWYSIVGSSMLKNIRPFVAGYRFRSLGFAYHRNLVNYQVLRAKCKDNGSLFNTSFDTEAVLHVVAIQIIGLSYWGLLMCVSSNNMSLEWKFFAEKLQYRVKELRRLG